VKQGAKMRILLVEDDETTVESIKLGLEIFKPGTDVVSVDKGLDALKKIKEGSFDVVFLDLGLFDIDGIEVLKQARQFSNLPIIIISARTNQEVIENTQKLGANDFVIKPFDYHVLIKSLEAVTDKK
jgi:two-component system, OmpR family, KDP operon response regulator KdpE